MIDITQKTASKNVTSTNAKEHNKDDVDDLIKGNRGLTLVRSVVLKGSNVILSFMKSEKYLNILYPKEKPNLLASKSDPLSILVNVVLWTTCKNGKYFPIRMHDLPYDVHSHVTKRICLIVPNKEGKTPSETSTFYKTIAQSVNQRHEFDVVTYKDLKPMIETFGDARTFVKSYDMFLADSALKEVILRKLGVTFKRGNKFPLCINLTSRTELKRTLCGTHFFMHSMGNNFSYPVGNTNMTSQELTENVIESLSQMTKKVDNGWRNVRSVGLIGLKTSFIPIYDASDASSFNELREIYSKFEEKNLKRETSTKSEKSVDAAQNGAKIQKLATKDKSEDTSLKVEKVKTVGLKVVDKPETKSFSKISELKRRLLTPNVNHKKKKNSSTVASTQEGQNNKSQLQVPELSSVDVLEDKTLSKVMNNKIRSTSDVAIKKSEKRKLKREAEKQENPSDQFNLTGYEKHVFGDEPASKKPKEEPKSPKLTEYEKHVLKGDDGLPSKDHYNSEKKKKKNKALLSGFEKFLFSEQNQSKSEKKKLNNDADVDDVDIPENFFDDSDVTGDEVAPPQSVQKKKAAAVKKSPKSAVKKRLSRKTDVSLLNDGNDENINTPLRRSGRVRKPVKD